MEAATAPALRILHAPRNMANQAGYAAAGLRRLGHHVEVWEDRPSAFGFPTDRILPYEAHDPWATWEAICEAIERFDVLHFHFAQTLVPRGWGSLPPLWDLPLYRDLGKRVFFTFHGTDVRIGRIHEAINPWAAHLKVAAPPEDDRIEKTIEVIRTYANAMFVVSVRMLHFVPDATYLPRIFDLAAWPEQPPEQRPRPVVVHAPSARGTKGTDRILAGLDELAGESVGFELRLLEGMPHDRVRAEIAAADILVDNVIAGSYGLVSMEAMACSRVAVANVCDEVAAAHPDCPVVNVDPDTFRDRMRALIGNVDERRAIAAAGRPFVARVHDADRIAARLVAAYTAPAAAVRRRSMPGWMSYERQRRVEELEARMGRLETELARAALRERQLRARLGIAPDADVAPWVRLRAVGRLVVPGRIRSRLRRLAARR